jgi:putative DNA primase/helicase
LSSSIFVSASESNSQGTFNEQKLKQITGGNYIRTAFKYKTHFEYQPKFKFWLTSNFLPNLNPNDDAIWARFRLINFPISHLGSEDKSLKYKFQQSDELSGVLRFCVEGAIKYFQLENGLPTPEISTNLLIALKEDQDTIQQFIDDECQISDPSKFTPVRDLYSRYTSWTERNGFLAENIKQFSSSLKVKGYKPGRPKTDGKQSRGYFGIQLT